MINRSVGAAELNYISWGGCQIESNTVGRFQRKTGFSGGLTADATSGFPLLLYDRANAHGLVLSPLSNYHVGIHSTAGADHALEAGIKATVKQIPANFTHTTVAFASTSIARALHGWGDALLLQGGKARPDPSGYDDWVLSRLGYWTDNGAYYYRSNGSFATKLGKALAKFHAIDSHWYDAFRASYIAHMPELAAVPRSCGAGSRIL